MAEAAWYIPGYWRQETSGVLRPAIEDYLHGRALTPADIAALRAYLRQWIFSPVWLGEEIGALREQIDGLTTREAIAAWLADVTALGIDPL